MLAAPSITEERRADPPRHRVEVLPARGHRALAVLEGLCPTLVINAEYDDSRSSGEALAAALALAGVDVRQVTAVGMLHGFRNTRADLEPVDRALTLMADVVTTSRTPDTLEIPA